MTGQIGHQNSESRALMLNEFQVSSAEIMVLLQVEG